MTDLLNHRKDHICHICNNTFQSVSDLKQHILTHVKIVNQINQFCAVDDIFLKDFKEEDSLEEILTKKKHVNNNQEISFEPSKNHTNNSSKEKENNVSLSDVECKSVVKVEGIVDSKNATCIKTSNDAAVVVDIIEEDKRSHSSSNEFIANKDDKTTTLTDLYKTIKKIDNCVLSGTATLSHTVERTDTKQSSTVDGTVTLQNEQPFNYKFSCQKCNKTFVYSNSLKEHKTIHSDNNPFNCGDCGKNFSRFSHLHDHMLVHTGVRPYVCLLCNLEFNHTGKLNAHIRRRHSNIIFCMICGKIFDKNQLLQLHLKSHTSKEQRISTTSNIKQGERGFAKCLLCKSLFSNVEHLDQHNRKYHKLFTCKICNKSFNRPNLLHSHSFRHSGERTILCSICGKYYASKRHLNRHMKTHAEKKYYTCEICGKEVKCMEIHLQSHSSEKRFTCEICGNAYMYKSSLLDHQKLHETKDKLHCDHCNKRFSKMQNIRGHIRNIHLGKGAFHTCHICKKKILGGKGHLKAHIHLHTGVKTHECKICGKKCANSRNLRSHLFSHSNEQPFSCEQCEQRFKRRENLKTHMLIHTGEKPHKWGICGQKFRQRGSVKIHKKNIHNK